MAQFPAPPTSAQPRRRLWPKVLLLLGTLALTLFGVDRLIEMLNLFGVHYARESNRYRGNLTEMVFQRPDGSLDLDGELFKQKPGASTKFCDFEVKINSLGFRGPEVEQEKPDGVYRIVALGDSVTFGWGVNDEHTYIRRLEVELNRQIQGRRFEVINTGHPMYDTVQEHAMLQRHAMALKPDLVILIYVVNDIDPTRKVVEDYVAVLAKAKANPDAVPAPVSQPWRRSIATGADGLFHRLERPTPTTCKNGSRTGSTVGIAARQRC